MPFDDAGFMQETAVRAPPTDPLEAMGITPVPEAFVREYKPRYARRYRADHPHAPGPLEWRTANLASWDKTALASMLEFGVRGLISRDVSAAPKELITLAERVRKAIPDASFSVDYFYKDPVLKVTYSSAGHVSTACLGIWDAGEIIAIATSPTPERRPSPVSRAWSATTRFFMSPLNFH